MQRYTAWHAVSNCEKAAWLLRDSSVGALAVRRDDAAAELGEQRDEPGVALAEHARQLHRHKPALLPCPAKNLGFQCFGLPYPNTLIPLSFLMSWASEIDPYD